MKALISNLIPGTQKVKDKKNLNLIKPKVQSK